MAYTPTKLLGAILGAISSKKLSDDFASRVDALSSPYVLLCIRRTLPWLACMESSHRLQTGFRVENLPRVAIARKR